MGYTRKMALPVTIISIAMQRAKQLDKDAASAGEPGRNPTTGVYRLIAEIQKG